MSSPNCVFLIAKQKFPLVRVTLQPNSLIYAIVSESESEANGVDLGGIRAELDREGEISAVTKLLENALASANESLKGAQTTPELRQIFRDHVRQALLEQGYTCNEQINAQFIMIDGKLEMLPAEDHRDPETISFLHQFGLDLAKSFRINEYERIAGMEDALKAGDRARAMRLFIEAYKAGATIVYPIQGFLEVGRGIGILQSGVPEEAEFCFALFEVARAGNDTETMTKAYDALVSLPGATIDPKRILGLCGLQARSLIDMAAMEAAKGCLARALKISEDIEDALWRGGVNEDLSRCFPFASDERIQHLEKACDLFRQCGANDHLGRCAGVLAQQQKFGNRKAALATLRDAIRWLGQANRPEEMVVRSMLLSDLAELLTDEEDLPGAKSLVAEALQLISGVAQCGALQARCRISAQALQLARNMHESSEEIDACEARSEAAHRASSAERAELSAAMVSMIRDSPERLRDLVPRIEANGDNMLATRFWWARALVEPAIQRETRFAYMEKAIAACDKIRSEYMRREERGFLMCELGTMLRAEDRFRDALVYFHQAVSLDPFSESAIWGVVDCMQRGGLWAASIPALLVAHRARPGDVHVVYCLGRAYSKSGKSRDAIAYLRRGLALNKEESELYKLTQKILTELVLRGADMSPEPENIPREQGPVSIKDFEAALDEFGLHVTRNMRMNFWEYDKVAKKHAWHRKPEHLAGLMFDTFVRGRFGNRIRTFTEVGIGSGRIDFFIMFSMSISVVVELKMCGGGGVHTQTYALDGAPQVAHYAKNMSTRLAYLVVFDGRSRDLGKGITPEIQSGDIMVSCRFIDIRHDSPSKLGDA